MLHCIVQALHSTLICIRLRYTMLIALNFSDTRSFYHDSSTGPLTEFLCGFGMFNCTNGGCININLVCDGDVDCESDESDEEDCRKQNTDTLTCYTTWLNQIVVTLLIRWVGPTMVWFPDLVVWFPDQQWSDSQTLWSDSQTKTSMHALWSWVLNMFTKKTGEI